MVAWLLYRNGRYTGGHYPSNPHSLPGIRMPNHNGFVPDPRPDVELTDKTLKFIVRPQIQGVGQADYSWD